MLAASSFSIAWRARMRCTTRLTSRLGRGSEKGRTRPAWLVGIYTRNARQAAELTVRGLDMQVDMIVAREDAPPKPDPDGLLLRIKAWCLAPRDVLYVGDYRLDFEGGRRAGVRTVLFTPQPSDFEHDASEVINALEHVLAHLC